MKLRIAKKIAKRRKTTIAFEIYDYLYGREYYLAMKAYARIDKYMKKVVCRYISKKATFEISNGKQTVRGTAGIVKWNKKYVWLNNNPTESGIRFPWSDIIKVE